MDSSDSTLASDLLGIGAGAVIEESGSSTESPESILILDLLGRPGALYVWGSPDSMPDSDLLLYHLNWGSTCSGIWAIHSRKDACTTWVVLSEPHGKLEVEGAAAPRLNRPTSVAKKSMLFHVFDALDTGECENMKNSKPSCNLEISRSEISFK